MPVLWVGVLAGFYLGPFTFYPVPSWTTLLFLLICTGLFTLASFVGYTFHSTPAWTRRASVTPLLPPAFDVNRVIGRLSGPAIVGVLVLFMERISSLGFTGLSGFTE